MTADFAEQRRRRLLEIPVEIARINRQLVAMRAERDNTERALKRRETYVRQGARLRESYKQLKSEAERTDYLRVQVYEDIEYEHLADRLEQIAVQIDKLVFEKDALEHERKALYAALISYAAEIFEKKIDEKTLADMAGRGRVLS
ncbi:hypothetical protein [Meiothermus hypogaeus]|uniref:Flagellar FliJ protein n=2 Tax=Meiothermus hypogaeus TaxID=884155 RepID=A0A511QY47_9DEIN|nr:hypothetical protein [Meiothermus hypogaeus]RIH78968.1 hypothetical protein Mhypo_01331 [Meiothermus hypogaeus]GEM81917.1 hypothetical protein MHY01S_00830 [Meiothermus hypogaeus NBRC 106114]GIW30184.1 MAG: hypothetical protein KatS3mg071_0358 [Meiothermus sp.]